MSLRIALLFISLVLCRVDSYGQDAKFELEGWLGYSSIQADGTPSWLTGETGKLIHGGDNDHTAFGRGQVAITYRPTAFLTAYAHVLGRLEPSENQGDAWGFAEAYLESQIERGRHGFRMRLGWFFPPTSMENIDPLWVSPYTLTLSSINSWLAEEMRLTGLDLRYNFDFGASTLFGEATLLAGNDSLGALIAWRGWTLGQRISVWNETLPLPPLNSLEPGMPFEPQNTAGTQPVTSDLDGRLGFAGRLAFEWSKGLIILNHLDNRSDRGLYDGEYAWHTQLNQVSFSWFPTRRLSLLGEYLDAETGMGFQNLPHVQTRFDAWYLMPSLEMGPLRFSLRYDRFNSEDLDRQRVAINADQNDEDGDSWTAALLWQIQKSWRIGLEWLDLKADRPSHSRKQGEYQLDASSLSLEVRFTF